MLQKIVFSPVYSYIELKQNLQTKDSCNEATVSTALILCSFVELGAMEHNHIEKKVEKLLNMIDCTAASLTHNDEQISTWFVFVVM